MFGTIADVVSWQLHKPLMTCTKTPVTETKANAVKSIGSCIHAMWGCLFLNEEHTDTKTHSHKHIIKYNCKYINVHILRCIPNGKAEMNKNEKQSISEHSTKNILWVLVL